MKNVKSIKTIFLFCLLIVATFYSTLKAQIPTKCLEVESILVDACGSPEGENEMVTFKVGPTSINTSDLTITWPNNSFIGISPSNALTASIVATLNATIVSCGRLIEPVGGVLPAGKSVLMVTSTAMNTSANSFANLTDTLYIIFQNAGNTSGHFANHSTPSGLRTTIIKQISINCSDTVIYDKVLLINQLGGYGGTAAQKDGATAQFSWAGVATYVNNGCMAPFIPITISAGTGSTICAGTTVNLAGTATGNYSSVIWQSSGGIFSTSNSLTTVFTAPPTAGTVTITLGAIGPCQDTVTSTITMNIISVPSPVIATSGSTAICAGNSVTLSALGGSSYVWSTGATTNVTTVSASGTYTVTATNSCGSQTATQVVTVTPLPTANANSTASSVCSGGSLLLWTTGTGNFLWSNGENNDSTIVSTGGTYFVTASNSCGNVNDTVIIATLLPPSPIITVSGSTTICAGNTVNLVASGGTSYLWSTGAATNSISVSTGGTYTVTATNTCGSQTATQLVTVQPLPTATINSIATSFCSGDSLLLWSTGIGTFLWSNGQSNDSIIISTEGTYFVTSSNSCGSLNDTILASMLPLPSPIITAIGSTTVCAGDSVTLNASGGSTYLWSTGSTSSAITVFTGGTYTVTATNSCGSLPATTIIIINILPLGSINSLDTTVCPGNTLLLWATGTGSYSWSTGEINDSVYVGSGGSYILTSTNSCGITTDSITITQQLLPTTTITAAGSTTICNGNSVMLNGSGGTTYLWQPSSAITSSVSATLAGTYTLTAYNNCGSDTATINVSVINSPLATITSTGSTTICVGDSLTLSANGGGTYLWSTGSTINSININNQGLYYVIVSNICGSDTASINVVSDSVNALFTGNSISGISPLTIDFTNSSSLNAITYSWSFGDGNSSNLFSPTNTFQTPGVYNVILTVTNANGCTDSYLIQITVFENPSILNVPNVFSPNNDGDNDSFIVTSSGIKEFECAIYDRWGLKMIVLPSVEIGWDGRTDTGVSVSDGTYYYIIKATGLDNKIYNKTGFVLLIR